MYYSALVERGMDKQKLGLLIKERRDFLSITQKELAEISGVTLRKLVDIENGKANPTLETLTKLFNTLGLKITVEAK
jgi:transcriptional regulator with XRE-family HTH domain